MATSKFTRKFELANGVPLLGAIVYLVPQAGTYPTDALLCTEHGTRQGVYYREALPDGEYKIYIGTGGNAPVLTDSNIWIGEQRITDITTSLAGIKSVTKTFTGEGAFDPLPPGSALLYAVVKNIGTADAPTLHIDFTLGSAATNSNRTGVYPCRTQYINEEDPVTVSLDYWADVVLEITLIYI